MAEKTERKGYHLSDVVKQKASGPGNRLRWRMQETEGGPREEVKEKHGVGPRSKELTI